MEMKWLEDFVLLAQIKNFSKTAELRNVTQPAFSRRIQSLETWLGVSLIDRTSFPTRLTASGEVFYEQSLKMLEQIREIRTLMKAGNSLHGPIIDFAVPHNLSLTFFPEWLNSISYLMGETSYRLRALNVHDAVMTLINGGCDLLMAYYHASQALQIDPAHYQMVVLGTENISPYSLADKQGKPVFQMHSGNIKVATPFLAYTNSAYLGKIVEFMLRKSSQPPALKTVYETDMAEGLKSMMMAGHGIAFLPESSVKAELASGAVVKALDKPNPEFDLSLEIRLYREIPHMPHDTKKTQKSEEKRLANRKSEVMEKMWQVLASKQN